jgi:hypothetical protein
VPVSWEKATRRISLADPARAWKELLEEIELLDVADRFDVEISGEAADDARNARIGSVISRGFSLQTADPVVLVPRPSGVLYLVSPLGPDDIPTWISHVPAGHFRQHLLVLDAADETFARLAATCAGESWHLDAFAQRSGAAELVMELVGSRPIDLVQVVQARLGVDLVPTLNAAYPATRVVVDVRSESAPGQVWLTYVTSRYGNVIDAFCAWRAVDVANLEKAGIANSRISLVPSEQDGPGETLAAATHEQMYGQLIAASAR